MATRIYTPKVVGAKNVVQLRRLKKLNGGRELVGIKQGVAQLAERRAWDAEAARSKLATLTIFTVV